MMTAQGLVGHETLFYKREILIRPQDIVPSGEA
jgi:hypothetical protein